MGAVVLYRVDPARNMRRYYRLDVQPDLFGLWLFVSEWGRIGQPGQTRIASFATLEQADAALRRQRRIKEMRGYVEPAGSSAGGFRFTATPRGGGRLSQSPAYVLRY